ncbi:archaea-specific SMC-related protein [Halobacterium bonnevillei]|uniref:AAA family ATPase n=1 Tax=Halobacterium bonnevillei TaxID=2692200 RepID=A0A6B0SMC2_9EURY|nr:archaea-specific SMC-related protein [Halobacterium bonnevillei]MXR21636.1 AAA family ATPase [Halobacterium bonnevillei]
MDQPAALQSAARIRAQNVGGIDETDVDLEPGVNVLVGRNATNRTSFLQAVMAALGSTNATLKGDAEEGRVELELGGDTYERKLHRVDGDVVFGGDAYLDDPELAELFAFLLESNEARRAVEHGEDLREIIVRPVDTAHLRSEIERLEGEKRDIDSELADLDDVEARVANREQRVAELEAEREDLQAELKEARDALDEVEAEEGGSEALSELKEQRSDLEDVRFRLRTERESLESLREQREDLRQERDTLPAGDVDVDALAENIEQLRERRSTLDAEINDLQSVIRFNEEFLEGSAGIQEDIENELGAAEDTDGAVTDALLADDRQVCWTCGTNVEADRIDSTVQHLRDLRERKLAEKAEVSEELDDLTERRKEVSNVEQRRSELEQSLERVEEEIEEREARVEELAADRDALEADVEDLETAVEDDGRDAALDRAKRVNELEVQLDRVTEDLADARETVRELQARLDSREELEEQRAGVVESLRDLRERVDSVEAAAVDAFNDHMETVLDRLDYENIERIWIERTTARTKSGRQTVEQSEFELHVVRASADGTAYEDTVDHLSESEREVTGLVFALAGYLVHDVYETVPFMLLDSLEAIDSDRIASLVDYVSEYADFLVVALLPEDAQAVDVDNRVTEI